MMYCLWIQIIDVPPVRASESVCEWTSIWLDPSGGRPHWPHAVLMASEAHVSACEKTTVEWNLPLWADSCSHCVAKLTVRTWALDCLFMCCEFTALLTLQKQKLHLKMHLQTFNAADRQHFYFFYFVAQCYYIIAQLFIYIYIYIYIYI